MMYPQTLATFVLGLLLAANAFPFRDASTYADTRNLLTALSDVRDDRDVLAALFKKGDARIDDLIKALDDPDRNVSLRAQIVICYLGNQAGMKALDDWYSKQNEIPISGPIPLPLMARDYEFIKDQFIAKPPITWASAEKYIYALALDRSPRARSVLREMLKRKWRADEGLAAGLALKRVRVGHPEKLLTGENDLAKLVLRKAFFVGRRSRPYASARLLGLNGVKDKALVEVYVNPGPLAEEWYHVVLSKHQTRLEILLHHSGCPIINSCRSRLRSGMRLTFSPRLTIAQNRHDLKTQIVESRVETKDYLIWNGTRTYDAENRMIVANNGTANSYSYDGDGRRVKRIIGSTETWQVYGLGGELLAEYSAGANPASPQKEYGYRNGQLLITATVTAAGWGSPPSYTPPNPLSSGIPIKLEHLTELRSAVNLLRGHAGLSPFNFTVDPNPERNVTTVKADHILQLRTALEQARSQLGLSTGGYAHPGLHTGDLIYAIDFQELRDQILSAWNSSAGGVDIRWLVTDQLGTPRMVFDQSGSLTVADQNGNYVSGMTRHDYLPFGEELFAGTGGRTTAQGYSSNDGLRNRFTGKERDNETGLDYFGARYYASTQGRFTSVDPISITLTRLVDPQRINLYAHWRNNPEKYIDSNGEDLVLANNTAHERARANIDARLRPDERANVIIVLQKCLQLSWNVIDSRSL